MIERRLLRQIEKVAERARRRQLLVSLGACWLGATLAAVVLLAGNRTAGWFVPHASWILAAAVGFAAIAAWWLAYQAWRSPRKVARRIEAIYPELNANLLAAIDQRAPVGDSRYGYLQTCVIDEALRHAYRNSWTRAIPPWQILSAHCANLLTFTGLMIALIFLSGMERPVAADGAGEAAAPQIALVGDFQISVEPGDAEVERGTSLLVMARFLDTLPPEATLHVGRMDGAEEQFGMSKSLDDPLFGARIPEIDSDVRYHVEFADQRSDSYQVTVFELPRLVRADAELSFPDYTSMTARIVEDVRKVSAVEGTHLTLLCHLNKSVAAAEFVDRAGQRTSLQPAADDSLLYSAEFDLMKSLRFELHLVDSEGRKNKQPPEFVITTLPNQPPDLKLVQPSRDLEVSPLEEIDLKANAWDDFGLSRIGLSYMLADHSEEVVLAQTVTGKERTAAEYMLAMESLEAEPNHLVSYYFWAEDHGPDGGVRRVSSDMYFAEVRHFDEVFRQGQQPPGGAQPPSGQNQGGAGQPSQQLAELQRQIINGTWKVIRREISATPSDQFSDDVGLLLESQTDALEQAEALGEQLQEAASARHLLDVRRKMLEAIQHLSEAQTNSQIEALHPALLAEQGASQALLRLRSTEHEVTQGQPGGGGGGGGGNRSQRQLDQMQLRDNEDRYESETTAQSQQEQQDGETRQVLNRLKELARRQGDLNERLKELQSALEEAEDEAQREELRRQLQRLREEQQRILRDIDDVRERMDQPQNQERMANEQQQLAETRENVRRASEALDEGRISRAVAAGTRAEREFEELRDEFRRRSSGRFQEEMREMRAAAQELDEQQQQVSDQLDTMNDPASETKSLREADQRESLEDELTAQRERLEKLLENMREMVQEAESSEPLLADGLYDTAREALQDNLPSALDAAARSIRRGLLDDAQQLEQRAQTGIQNLRAGVERAAEHVLGDETEALRRAREEIEQLRSDLDDEISRLAPGQQQPSENQEPGRFVPGEEGRPLGGTEEQGQGRESDGQGREQDQDQESEGQGQQQGQGQGGQQGQSEQQQGQRGGGEGEQDSEQEGGQGQPGQRGGQGEGRQRLTGQGGGRGGGDDLLGGFVNDRDTAAPLTGDDFVEWSDRLRDVEEMIADPEMRAEAARIRGRARAVRRELKRHARLPDWDSIELQIVKPLAELQDRVSEELLRRSSPKSLVPIDRDPVPPRFSEQVRQYYENLGSSQ